MSDVRSPDDLVAIVSELQAKIADLESTLTMRTARSPTGDVEPTIRTTAKTNTLLLQGQAISRVTYSVLWQWVVDNGLSPSVFGAGDGSTTFTLPDMRGRVPLGAGTLGADTYTLGTVGGLATRAIGLGSLPNHNHGDGLTDWSDRTHYHGGQTDDAGNHGGHNSGASDAAIGPGRSIAGNSQNTWGNHSHHFDTATETQGHKHEFSTSSTGSGNPFDVRQPYYVLNWLIWI